MTIISSFKNLYFHSSHFWVTFLAETSKDLEITLIIIVLSFTNRLSRTSLYLSLKTSFVYSNLFSLAKTVTIRCYIQTGKRVRSPSSACKKARATAKKLQSINHFTVHIIFVIVTYLLIRPHPTSMFGKYLFGRRFEI